MYRMSQSVVFQSNMLVFFFFFFLGPVFRPGNVHRRNRFQGKRVVVGSQKNSENFSNSSVDLSEVVEG